MNAPERYRKKPVVIEAMQYGPYTAPSLALAQFLAGTGAKAVTEGIKIPTLEGDMLASPGDWIIKGVKGEPYPCKPDIFAATYEPADTSATPDPLSDPRVKALVELMREASDDLKTYAEAGWPADLRAKYPSYQRKWEHEMELCNRIDAALRAIDGAAALTPTPVDASQPPNPLSDPRVKALVRAIKEVLVDAEELRPTARAALRAIEDGGE